MSDFASFVAATLRDKAMSDLLEENQKLREKNHALEFVEITGPERHPVYARGHLRDNGRVYTNNTELWDVDMEQLVPCPLQDLAYIEVWARNCIVAEVSPDNDYAKIPEVGIRGSVNTDRKKVFFSFDSASLFVEMDFGWT